MWHLPLAHRFERDRSLIQTLELLRISLTAGCPVNDAIRGTLDLDVNRWFRQRLRCWLTCVERGEGIAQSARQCGLGRALAWAFDGGINAGNTPAILQMLESHHRALYSYRSNMTRYILWPVGILMLGLMVGFVAYAMFSPAVAVINLMALNVYP
jgi:type II secretory pathway component PulF